MGPRGIPQALLFANGPIATFLLPLAESRTCFDGGAFGLEPRLPHRPRLPDPAPLPHHHPGTEERSGDRDAVEPLLVQRGNPLFEIDRGDALAAQFFT